MRHHWLAVCLLAGALAAPAWAGGTLRVCDDVAPPQTLDPQHEFSEKNHTIVQQIYDGLVRFDSVGVISPALALSWRPLDQPTDPKAPPVFGLRFVLRQGVKFHNGEPFNAQAVRFSIQRYLDPKAPSPASVFLDSIAGVNVVDDYTAEIITRYPDGLLLSRLAGFVMIVPPKYVSASPPGTLDRHPVGTGAFCCKSWDPKSDHIELEANRAYWLRGFPRLDKLVFRFAPSEEQAKLLLSGQVDLVTELPGTYTTEVKENKGTTIDKQATYWTVGATMNVTDGPLKDVRIRRALNLAINRDDLVHFDSKGNGNVLASLTMPGEEGHNPDLKCYPYDLDQARKLLAEAGVKTPLVLKTHVRAQSLRTASILAAQFKKIGVDLDITAVSSDADVVARVKAEHWDIGIAGFADPMCNSFFIQSVLLFSKSPFTLTNDKGFDDHLLAYITTVQPDQHQAAGHALDKYVYDQALSLFTYQKIKTYGLSRTAHFDPYISGMPYFLSARVDAGAVPAQAAVETH